MSREFYLHDAGEDTIHANNIVPTTAKEKSQNWWFYNKVRVIVGVIVACVVGGSVYSAVTRVHPDYSIALMTSYSMPQEALVQLEDYLAQYADDRNGDGKVKVFLNNYIFSESDVTGNPQAYQASLVRFTADGSVGDNIIYLHNKSAFDLMEPNLKGYFSYNDGTPVPQEAKDFENAMYEWKDVEALSEFKFSTAGNDPNITDKEIYNENMQGLIENLRLSIRTSNETAFERKEKSMEYYEDCVAMYQRILNNEKVSDISGNSEVSAGSEGSEG